MQVPQLQFAQTPIIQPRSEMAGFSDALLQAGQMRQQRVTAERARADQMAQQQFQNELATQQMGILQDQLGLQKEQSVRQGEAHGLQMELGAQTKQSNQDKLQEEVRRQKLGQLLSTPETSAALKELPASKQIEYISQLAISNGLAMPEDIIDGFKNQLNARVQEDALLTNQFQRQTAVLQQAQIRQNMALAKAKAENPSGIITPDQALKWSKPYIDRAEKAETYANDFTAKGVSARTAIRALQSNNVEEATAALDKAGLLDPKMAAMLREITGKMSPEQMQAKNEAIVDYVEGQAQILDQVVLENLKIRDAEYKTGSGILQSGTLPPLFGFEPQQPVMPPQPQPSAMQQAGMGLQGVVQEAGQQTQQLFGTFFDALAKQQYAASRGGRQSAGSTVMSNFAKANAATDKPIDRPSAATPPSLIDMGGMTPHLRHQTAPPMGVPIEAGIESAPYGIPAEQRPVPQAFLPPQPYIPATGSAPLRRLQQGGKFSG